MLVPGPLLSSSPGGGRARARVRRLATVGAVTAAVVMGQASAVSAAPASPPNVSPAFTESVRPVLRAATTTPGTGSASLKFYARTVGSATWDLLDGATVSVPTVSGATGSASLRAG